MIELIYGLLGFVLALGIFMLGFIAGKKFKEPEVKADPGAEEQERIRKERERMEQEQAAFRALTGYSADIAYGLTSFPEEGVK